MPPKVDPGVDFWTEEEIQEEQRLYGKEHANETLERLFQVKRKDKGEKCEIANFCSVLSLNQFLF